MKNFETLIVIIYQAIGYLWHFIVYIMLIPFFLIAFSQGFDYLLFEVLFKLQVTIPEVLVPVYNLFAALVISVGVLILVEAMIVLYEESKAFPFTTVHHKQLQPGKLAQVGWYGKVRHPMLLGYLIALVGVGLLVQSATMIFWWVPLFGGVILWFTINSEEKKLLRWFGDEYRAYQKNTPALFPKLLK